MNPSFHKFKSLLFVVALMMLMACTDTDQAGDQADAGHQMGTDHSGHEMDMEPSGEGFFSDGSLYQVGSKWHTQAGDIIEIGDLGGRFVFIALTYTSCEFSCPLIVADMQRILKQLPAGDKSRVRMVLLSLDPERDTPETMEAFAVQKGLAPEAWTLLSGDADDVMEMAALLGVRYKKMPDGEFSHSNIITLLNPDGEVLHQQNGLGPELTEASIKVLESHQ